MAFVNRKNNDNAKKPVLFFAVVSTICFLLSSSVLPFLAGAKNAPVPELLLCLVCMLPVYLDRKNACIFALSLGFLSDLFINEPISLSPVIFVAAVAIMSAMGKRFSDSGTLSIAVCALPALILRMIADTICYLIRFSDSELFSLILNVTFPHLLVNFATIIATAFIIGFFAKRFSIYAL